MWMYEFLHVRDNLFRVSRQCQRGEEVITPRQSISPLSSTLCLISYRNSIPGGPQLALCRHSGGPPAGPEPSAGHTM